jgi:hypothetical protein
MSNSPAHDLALYLDASGVGTFAGTSSWAIAAGREPIAPDDAVTLYDTPGPGPTDDDQDLFEVTIQVRVRSNSYPAAYAKQVAIRDLLILPNFITADTSRFRGVFMTADIAGLGRDDNDRHLLVANYTALRTTD